MNGKHKLIKNGEIGGVAVIKQILPRGNLEIADNVLSLIILMCLEDMEDVEVLSYFKDDIRGIFHKKYYKGIWIDSSDADIEIEVKLELRNPKNMIDTCMKLQKLLVEEIYKMTGLTVTNLLIKVEKVQM